MIEKIKVMGGLVLDLCPYDRDFTGFECPNAFNPTRLKKSFLIGL